MGGAELKQEERKELILLFRGHSPQVRVLGGPSQCPPCHPWSLLGSLCIVTNGLALA